MKIEQTLFFLLVVYTLSVAKDFTTIFKKSQFLRTLRDAAIQRDENKFRDEVFNLQKREISSFIHKLKRSAEVRPCPDSFSNVEPVKDEHLDCLPIYGSDGENVVKTLNTLEKLKIYSEEEELNKSTSGDIVLKDIVTDEAIKTAETKQDFDQKGSPPDLESDKISTEKNLEDGKETSSGAEENSEISETILIVTPEEVTQIPSSKDFVELRNSEDEFKSVTAIRQSTPHMNDENGDVISSETNIYDQNYQTGAPYSTTGINEKTERIMEGTEMAEVQTAHFEEVTTIDPYFYNVNDIKEEVVKIDISKESSTPNNTLLPQILFNEPEKYNNTTNEYIKETETFKMVTDTLDTIPVEDHNSSMPKTSTHEIDVYIENGTFLRAPGIINEENLSITVSQKTSQDFGTTNIRLSTLVAAWVGGFFGTFVLISLVAAYVRSQERKKGKTYSLQKDEDDLLEDVATTKI